MLQTNINEPCADNDMWECRSAKHAHKFFSSLLLSSPLHLRTHSLPRILTQLFRRDSLSVFSYCFFPHCLIVVIIRTRGVVPEIQPLLFPLLLCLNRSAHFGQQKVYSFPSIVVACVANVHGSAMISVLQKSHWMNLVFISSPLCSSVSRSNPLSLRVRRLQQGLSSASSREANHLAGLPRLLW